MQFKKGDILRRLVGKIPTLNVSRGNIFGDYVQMDWCVLYGRSKKITSLINIERATMQTQEKQIVKFMNPKSRSIYIWHTAQDAAVKAVDEYMKDKEEPMYCGSQMLKSDQKR